MNGTQPSSQSHSEPTRTGISDEHVLKAIAIMGANLEEPLSIESVAEAVRISVDTLERIFHRETDQPPVRYYRMLRLKRAQDLLCHSSLKVNQVAVACGFANPSSFARAYRGLFRRAPRDERSAVR